MSTSVVPVALRAAPVVATGVVAAPMTAGVIAVGAVAICGIMIVRKLTSSRFSFGYGDFRMDVEGE